MDRKGEDYLAHAAGPQPGSMPARRWAERLMLGLGAAAAVVAVGGLLASIDRFGAHPEIDQARHENALLRIEQEDLRHQALDLAERSVRAVVRGQRIALLSGVPVRDWESEGRPPPSNQAGNEELLRWLDEQQALLAAVEQGLTPEPVVTRGTAAIAAPGSVSIPPGSEQSIRRRKTSSSSR